MTVMSVSSLVIEEMLKKDVDESRYFCIFDCHWKNDEKRDDGFVMLVLLDIENEKDGRRRIV